MSTMAFSNVNLEWKEQPPKEVLEEVNKISRIYEWSDNNGSGYLDGNWYLEDIIDLLEPLKEYIKKGTIYYECDNGKAVAEFNGDWTEEWADQYYPSELPRYDVSSTERVKEILEIISKNAVKYDCGRKIFEGCEFTENEVKLYNLGWLND